MESIVATPFKITLMIICLDTFRVAVRHVSNKDNKKKRLEIIIPMPEVPSRFPIWKFREPEVIEMWWTSDRYKDF